MTGGGEQGGRGVIKNNNGMNQTAEGGTAIIIIHYSLTHSLTYQSALNSLTHWLNLLTHSLTLDSLNSTHSTHSHCRCLATSSLRMRRKRRSHFSAALPPLLAPLSLSW